MGYFGQVLEIFTGNFFSSALVGLSWPILFVKFLETKKEEEQMQEPEQQITTEEE